MPKLIRYRYKLYRRFELDIWGLLNSNPVYGHPIVKFFQDNYRYKAELSKRRFKQFIYRIDIVNPDKIYKRKKWRFVSMQLVRFFYRGLKYKYVAWIARKAAARSGYWLNNFLLLLESRLPVLLYRFNWIYNILFLKQFIGHGNVLVGSKSVFDVNYYVLPFQIITLRDTASMHVRDDLKSRLKFNMIFFSAPRFCFVSFKFMFGLLYKAPDLGDLAFPVSLDLYRLNDLS